MWDQLFDHAFVEHDDVTLAFLLFALGLFRGRIGEDGVPRSYRGLGGKEPLRL